MLKMREYKDSEGRQVFILEIKAEGVTVRHAFTKPDFSVDFKHLEPIPDGFQLEVDN